MDIAHMENVNPQAHNTNACVGNMPDTVDNAESSQHNDVCVDDDDPNNSYFDSVHSVQSFPFRRSK